MRRWMGFVFTVLLTSCGGDGNDPTRPPDENARVAPTLAFTFNDFHGLSEPLTVVTEADGSIYVGADSHDRDHPGWLQLYSPAGGFQHTIPVSRITSITLGTDGYFYMTRWEEETNGALGVWKYTREGNYLARWGGTSGSADGQFKGTTIGIALGPDGLVYVCDRDNDRVQVFRTDGTFVRKFGTTGSALGQLSRPQGIAIDADGNVFVADTGNDRVARFRSSGKAVKVWGNSGSGEGLFSEPRAVAVGPDGYVYVADTGNSRVQKFTADGEFLCSWGAGNQPRGICVGADGRVVVADTGNNRVLVFAYP